MKTMKTTTYTKRQVQLMFTALLVIFSQISFASTSPVSSKLNVIEVIGSSTGKSISLPVQSISIDMDNAKVKINWTTNNENNLSHFIVEKSTDGLNFSDAALVFAFGNTTSQMDYNFVDMLRNPQSDIIYYRLRTVSNDKTSQLSEVRVIRVVNKKEVKID